MENNRLALFPIQIPWAWEHYKKQMSCFWTPQEIDFSKDLDDWKKLTNDERHFLKHILAFFAISDRLVNINIETNFMEKFSDDLEIVCNYTFQEAMENIHNETYSLFVNTLIDPSEQPKIFDAIKTFPTIKKKVQWMEKYFESNILIETVIAFAIVEGVFFSGSFAAIYWMKERGLLPGLCKANEFIARDEGMHTDFACSVVKHLVGKEGTPPSFGHVKDMIEEAIQIETEFMVEALPCDLIGMNSKHMVQYIKYVADNLLVDLGYFAIYKWKNPFPFMNRINLSTKTNFFESRPTEYSRCVVTPISYDSD